MPHYPFVIMRQFLMLSFVVGAITSVGSHTALAAGSGSGGDGYNSQNASSCKQNEQYNEELKECVQKCKSGEVFSIDARKCVVKTSSLLKENDILSQAKILAYTGDYGQSLDLLWTIGDTKNPEVWNFRGFATRKSGNIKKGMKYYAQALELDPDYVLARQYMGEGYLQMGDVNAAKMQLSEIENRCGTYCNTYVTLSLMIKSAETNK